MPTLKELNVKPGDEVGLVDTPIAIWTCQPDGSLLADSEGSLSSDYFDGGKYSYYDKFCIISRASGTPPTWGEMTDAEKGALLLADHRGERIQQWDGCAWIGKVTGRFGNLVKYRRKPEPKRETVTLYTSKPGEEYGNERKAEDKHAITYDLLDGKPDWATLKGEDL